MDGDGKDAYARELIRHKARKLVGKCGFTPSDQDDIEQELTIHCWKRRRKFDPSRGQWSTFANHVLDNRIASIIEHRLAAMRDYRREAGSLDESICGPKGDGASRSELMDQNEGARRLGGGRSDHVEAADLKIDLSVFLSGLSPADRELCLSLQDHSPTETARQLGISRGTVYDRIGKLRPLFEDAGLKEYL